MVILPHFSDHYFLISQCLDYVVTFLDSPRSSDEMFCPANSFVCSQMLFISMRLSYRVNIEKAGPVALRVIVREMKKIVNIGSALCRRFLF